MLTALAMSHYRSLVNIGIVPGRLTLITGPNGSGKSNLYRGLRLLAESAQGGVVNAAARDGGLSSMLWAGPERPSRGMRAGQAPVQGGPRSRPVRLRLGFTSATYGYAFALGLPPPSRSAFALDPEIKRECLWAGPIYRPASVLVERDGPLIRAREGKNWQVLAQHVNPFDSLFSQVGDAVLTPEILALREQMRGWRFYDHFRTDHDAPVRQPQLGTRTPALHHDGRDLAAALQTIREIGDAALLEQSIADAFPGAELAIVRHGGGRLGVELSQPGLLRPMSSLELSEGTLRYLLWMAALLTPRPPPLMVLNEPETSLHPDLLPALARLIIRASGQTQVWVVSHENRLIQPLAEAEGCEWIVLEKTFGETRIQGQGLLEGPAWRWPED